MRKYQLTFPVKAIFPPVSENLLSEVSSAFARPLSFPEAFMDFLRQWNGLSCVEQDVVAPYLDITESHPEIGFYVKWLYGIGELSSECDIRFNNQDQSSDGLKSRHLLAIGEGSNGSRIVMSLASESYGQIATYHSQSAASAELAEQRLRLAAKSFDEFWDGLQPMSESLFAKQLALVDEMVEMMDTIRKSRETLGWEESNQIVLDILDGGPGDGPSVKRNLDELSKLLENPSGEPLQKRGEVQ